jgi:hypothetical protein
VNREFSQQEQEILVRLRGVRERAADLAQELHGVDQELAAVGEQREPYALLGTICESLEKLEALGSGALFWGLAGSGSDQLVAARARVGQFEATIGEIQARRQVTAAMLAEEREQLEILEDDLFQASEQEERRLQEWIVEREASVLPHQVTTMPWARGGEDDDRFHRALAASLLVSLLLGVLFPFIELPMLKRGEPVEIPERFARLIREEQPRVVPPPPPPREEPEPVPETPPDPVEPRPVEEPRPRDVPVPAVAETPAPRERPEPTGILAFRESFASLAENRPSARLGADARISNAGDAVGRTERSMLTTQAAGSSGGINLAAVSRDIGGGGAGQQIAGVEITRVASAIGTEGMRERPLSAGAGPSRTDEEIQIVFDRYKAALYRLYNRELRRDPTLRGQMVLRITIEPDGSVSLCELRSTDMSAPDLVSQVLERVRAFDFGAKEVPALTILYPIDFLPAG